MSEENQSVDELICEAQDALFENDFDRAVRLGESALQRAPRDADAHEVIVCAHSARGAFAEQHAAVMRWYRTVSASRLSVKLRKYAIESAFLAADREALVSQIQLILALNVTDADGDTSAWLNSLGATAALLCAEAGEGELASQLRARLTSNSDEDALLVRLVDAWLLGRVERDVDSACTLLRQLAGDARHGAAELAYIAAWAETLRLLLSGASDGVAFAEELLAQNVGAGTSLRIAMAVGTNDREAVTTLVQKQRDGMLGNVMPVVRRRLVQASAALAAT
jgi:hypothetical protein